MPDLLANILSIGIAIIFVSDIVISFIFVRKIKNVKFSSKDSTDELKNKMYEDLNYISKRLLTAFPQMKESKLRKKP